MISRPLLCALGLGVAGGMTSTHGEVQSPVPRDTGGPEPVIVIHDYKDGLSGIRPNPYFQRPDAKAGAPLDVSEVQGIGFAPQDRMSGRLAIGTFVVSK